MTPALRFFYRNHRGEVSVRQVANASAPYWGHNAWHKEPTWLMDAFDLEKGDIRTFAMKDMCGIGWVGDGIYELPVST